MQAIVVPDLPRVNLERMDKIYLRRRDLADKVKEEHSFIWRVIVAWAMAYFQGWRRLTSGSTGRASSNFVINVDSCAPVNRSVGRQVEWWTGK